MDNHGRVFYIDHKNHTTTWQKPPSIAAAAAATDLDDHNRAEGGGSGNGMDNMATAGTAAGRAASSRGGASSSTIYRRSRQQLDRRYQSIRKTMSQESNGDLFDSSGSGGGAGGCTEADNPLAFVHVATLTPERQRELLTKVRSNDGHNLELPSLW